ncbi:ChaB family protein [Desulfogranum marinum]|uniref:ChaB family protein n=1 Tax=Desulfogranum marinum TaxID=453220 RepID=UPI0019653CCF|nr:ChaB family protein [Desulfogranum marinum]MBM9514049.1 ChaB family protein [Desulfogranum marinum]
MPYQRLSDLPQPVRDALPEAAQDIYRAAFNSAWEQYKEKDARQGEDSREEVAHKVAWAAVKQKYEKDGGHWQRRKQ